MWLWCLSFTCVSSESSDCDLGSFASSAGGADSVGPFSGSEDLDDVVDDDDDVDVELELDSESELSNGEITSSSSNPVIPGSVSSVELIYERSNHNLKWATHSNNKG